MKANLDKNRFIQIKNNKHAHAWKTFVADNLEYNQPTGGAKILWTSWFYVLSWLLFIFPGILVSSYRKKRIQKLTSHFLQKRFLFFQKWFSVNFEDVDVIGRPNEQYFLILIMQNRGIGIPGDARVNQWSNGYSFQTKSDVTINVASAIWRWTRSNGKTTQVYYRRKLYTWIPNKAVKWQNFHFELKRDTMLTKKTNTLENKYFNKKWIYPNNDPIKIRRLLTPATQEAILEKIEKVKNGRTFYFLKKNEDFLMSVSYDLKTNPFQINIPISVDLGNKDKVVDAIYNDVISDISNVQEWLKILVIFYRLI